MMKKNSEILAPSCRLFIMLGLTEGGIVVIVATSEGQGWKLHESVIRFRQKVHSDLKSCAVPTNIWFESGCGVLDTH